MALCFALCALVDGYLYQQNWLELKDKWDAHEFQECTFKPQSIATYMRDARESVQKIRHRAKRSSRGGASGRQQAPLLFKTPVPLHVLNQSMSSR
jgi:hypothetical protein